LQIANSYNGITGDTSLNKAGDRKYGDYDDYGRQVVRKTLA